MTRLRRTALAGLAAVAIGGAASSAFAMELGTFENRLYGATVGLPLAAAPPPGVYSGLQTGYLGLPTVGSGGHSAGTWCIPSGGGSCAGLPAITQAVPLVWVPGWSFFGATYSASVVQAFYMFTTCGGETAGVIAPGFPGAGTPTAIAGNGSGDCKGAAPLSGGGFVYTNTFIAPIDVSWNLGGGWFMGTGFHFVPPDGTHQAGTPNPDYWTFEPALSFAYLGGSWVAAGNFFYEINTRSQGVCCSQDAAITDGNLLIGDLTLLYKIGKWSFGPVGAFEVQTTADTGCAGLVGPSGAALCGRRTNAQVGALVGYDFGPVDVQAFAMGVVEGQDTPQTTGGWNLGTRISFKIWGPSAPAPLVTKN